MLQLKQINSFLFKLRHPIKKGNRSKTTRDLHIQYDICFHHEEEHGHFHDKLYQQIFQIFLISHMRLVEAACCPSHQLPLFGAKE